MRKSPILALICLTVAPVSAYSQGAQAPSFEVASIKPASPSASAIKCSGGPGTSSPGIFRCSSVPLAFLISQSYGFQAWQFAPMAPCCRNRFDVTAEMPEGTSKEQFHQMLQNM